MRKIVTIILGSLPLFAGFFPATVHTTVKSVSGEEIRLSRPFPVQGMSGVVIHKFDKNLAAVTGYIEQTSSKGDAKLITKEIVRHEELPSIKTEVAKGDKVIGGYLYDNILLLAPDADTYTAITKRSTDKRWIHPDLFAVFLSEIGETYPTKENLAAFAKQYQIGLIYIIKRKNAVLFDPISGKVVASRTMSHTPKKTKSPFFMRFEEIKGGWFSDDAPGDYYTIMEQF